MTIYYRAATPNTYSKIAERLGEWFGDEDNPISASPAEIGGIVSQELAVVCDEDHRIICVAWAVDLEDALSDPTDACTSAEWIERIESGEAKMQTWRSLDEVANCYRTDDHDLADMTLHIHVGEAAEPCVSSWKIEAEPQDMIVCEAARLMAHKKLNLDDTRAAVAVFKVAGTKEKPVNEIMFRGELTADSKEA